MTDNTLNMDGMLRLSLMGGQARAFLCQSTRLVQDAQNIHHLSRVATAALGRLLTGASMMGAMLKDDRDSLTAYVKGGGPLGTVLAVAKADGSVKGYVDNPDIEPPLRPDGKLDVGGAVGKNGQLTVIKDLGKIATPLAFILLGMLFGSDGLFKIPFDNYALAEQICSVALIFIMFYGGFGTSWKAARPVAVPSILLSSLGVVLTALLTGVFCYFVLGFPLLESFLIGAVLGSTDAASVFSILRARNLALKENTSSLLEVESGSNDPCAYMLTTVLLTAMQGGIAPGQVAQLLAK